jgi:hypothetical protein
MKAYHDEGLVGEVDLAVTFGRDSKIKSSHNPTLRRTILDGPNYSEHRLWVPDNFRE